MKPALTGLTALTALPALPALTPAVEVRALAGVPLTESAIRDLATEAAESAFSIRAGSPMTTMLGSGFLTEHGIVTARHVLSPILFPGTADTVPGSWIRVRGLLAPLRDEASARLVGLSHEYDVALLDAQTEYPPLAWGDSDQMEVGQTVVVLASPGTLTSECKAYAAAGRVLATATVVPQLFRYEIPVQPGSSGGPVLLFDQQGRVIGINLLQERFGDRIVGSGLKTNTIRAVLAGEPPPRTLPVFIPEGLTSWDAILIGLALAGGLAIFMHKGVK